MRWLVGLLLAGGAVVVVRELARPEPVDDEQPMPGCSCGDC